MGLKSAFKKQQEPQVERVIESSADRIIFEELQEAKDELIVTLAKKLLNGYPLVLNFNALEVDLANKVIAFLSGVIFALDGEIVGIQDKVFLFARKQDFMDGTLNDFLAEVKN